MILKEMPATEFERSRQPVRRKCVKVLRGLIDALPPGCDPSMLLPFDRHAQDATFAMNAMGFTPAVIVTHVKRALLTERLVLEVLAQSVTVKLLQILRG